MSDFWGIGAATQAMGEFLGTMMTNDANNKTNRDNIAWQAKSLQATMNWQEHMRQTAYQTTVDDMRKAGLNPMLAYQQGGTGWGSVGSSPGSSIRAENPHIGNALAAGAGAMMNIATARENIATQRTQQGLNESTSAFNAAGVAERAANVDYLNARTRSEGGVPSVQAATIGQLAASARETLARIPVHEADTARSRAQAFQADSEGNRIRQDVVNRADYGRGGRVTDLVEGLSALLRRLQGLGNNSAPSIERQNRSSPTPWSNVYGGR